MRAGAKRARGSPSREARRGFTLVEGLVSLAVAAGMLLGLVTFFGDFLQRFSHQEDTLSGAHRAQLLLEWLRRDLRDLDGSSSDPAPLPGEALWAHLVHSPGGATLDQVLVRGTVPGGTLPAAHPAREAFRGDGAGVRRTRERLARAGDALAWIPEEDGTGGTLRLRVRRGGQLQQVRYRFSGPGSGLTREVAGGPPLPLAGASLQSFRATPSFEILHHPRDPGTPPELVKVWLELGFRLRGDDGGDSGKKITGRTVGFTTRLLPFHLNASLSSTWSP